MNLVGLIINLLFSDIFKQRPKKLKLEASISQGNGSNGISKRRVIHQYFYFIVIIFFRLSAYPFVNSLMFSKDYTDLNPKLFSIYQDLKYITHHQELKHITHRQVLQNTTNRYHHIP